MLVAMVSGLVIAALPPVTLAGPATQPDPAASMAAQTIAAQVTLPGPLLLHLPGIGGTRMCDERMTTGLREGGVNARIIIFDWTQNEPGIFALQGYERNHLEAQKIADLLVAHAAADPDSPIYITAHSGGCGLAVWALERLPANVKVQTVILIAPALSPQYDLSKALGHVVGRMYAITSTLDHIVLDTGTTLFGTIDGVQTPAAGFGGFVKPAGADTNEYLKLVPCPYQQAWTQYHDFGDHLGGMSRLFARQMLAPLLGAPAGDPATRPVSTQAP